MRCKTAPYGALQNGSHSEKKGTESKAKDTMVESKAKDTKKTSYQEAFRQEVTRTLGGKDGLPDE